MIKLGVKVKGSIIIVSSNQKLTETINRIVSILSSLHVGYFRQCLESSLQRLIYTVLLLMLAHPFQSLEGACKQYLA